jgi:hypothetical protein
MRFVPTSLLFIVLLETRVRGALGVRTSYRRTLGVSCSSCMFIVHVCIMGVWVHYFLDIPWAYQA